MNWASHRCHRFKQPWRKGNRSTSMSAGSTQMTPRLPSSNELGKKNRASHYPLGNDHAADRKEVKTVQNPARQRHHPFHLLNFFLLFLATAYFLDSFINLWIPKTSYFAFATCATRTTHTHHVYLPYMLSFLFCCFTLFKGDVFGRTSHDITARPGHKLAGYYDRIQSSCRVFHCGSVTGRVRARPPPTVFFKVALTLI